MIDFLTDNSGVIGLIFFMSAFLMIAFNAFRPSAKDRVESYKYIPLEEEQN